MANKILKKYFFIKKDYMVYCGKCGKKQLQDNHNLKKHAQSCGFKTEAEPRVKEDGNDFAYAFKISDDGSRLNFYVFSYSLELMPGFKDKYKGGTYKKIFMASFGKEKGDIKEKGLYNIDIWLKKMIDQDGIPSLSAESDINIFREFFTDILAFHSYGSFLDIYRNKGYGTKKLIDNEEADKILKFPNDKSRVPSGRLFVNGEIISLGGEDILHLFVNSLGNIYQADFLIGNGYAYGKGDCSVEIERFLMTNENGITNVVNNIPDNVIDRFNEMYPNFMLKHYLDAGGKNILIPLFSANYDKCLELLYKSGITELSDNFYHLKHNNNLVLYKNNIKDIFGLPVKTLKRISSKALAEETGMLDRLKEIYEYDKRYFDFNNYTRAALMFMKYTNITMANNFQYSRKYYIPAIRTWSPEKLFKTMKYLMNPKINNNSLVDTWELYKDYINMKYSLGDDNVSSDFPKDLQYAHDVMAELSYAASLSSETNEAFVQFVNSDFYLSFTTGIGEEKKEFEDDEFAIYAPKKPYDLVRESAQMNNCVKGYVNQIGNRETMVFFLRRKDNPAKSVCTIEVKSSLTLTQLKAYGNSIANNDIKQFVRRWAGIKGIKISAGRDL